MYKLSISMASHSLVYFDVCAFTFNLIVCSNNLLMVTWMVDGEKSHYTFFDIGFCQNFFSFFIFGLLADVRLGRYKTVITSVHCCFLSWIIFGLAVIVKSFTDFQVP